MAPKLTSTSVSPAALRADVLTVVCFREELSDHAGLQALDAAFDGALLPHLSAVEFTGKAGQLAEIPSLSRISAPKILFVGAGERGEGEVVRLEAAIAIALRGSLGVNPAVVGLVLPKGVQSYRAVAEGILLGAYRFTKYLTGERKPKQELTRVEIVGEGKLSPAQTRELELGRSIADAICVTRDVVNEPPNVLYPETLVARARELAKKHKLKLKVLDPKALTAAGHALHAAVGQGSVHGPYLVHLSYVPPKAKQRVVFVGKGITFDTGGICIKPMQGMADMKTDMAGAGAVLGLMAAVAAVGPDIEVHGILAAAENMPDGNAYRPADVLTSLSGKTVEIINTDAEGRLVLADALTYAVRLEPDAIVDAATLTGATLVSLGQPYSAFFSNDDVLAEAMQGASREAGESFWRMPLIEELAAQLKSDIADVKHVGDRYGGAITAALFLREFVGQVPWIHCDIPGAVYADRASGVYPKGATGHAVATFLKLVESFAAGKPISGRPREEKATTKKSGASKARTSRARATRARAARRVSAPSTSSRRASSGRRSR